MIAAPPWEKALAAWLEPSLPLMFAVALAIIALTVYLLWRRDPAMLALWLAYLLMP